MTKMAVKDRLSENGALVMAIADSGGGVSSSAHSFLNRGVVVSSQSALLSIAIYFVVSMFFAGSFNASAWSIAGDVLTLLLSCLLYATLIVRNAGHQFYPPQLLIGFQVRFGAFVAATAATATVLTIRVVLRFPGGEPHLRVIAITFLLLAAIGLLGQAWVAHLDRIGFFGLNVLVLADETEFLCVRKLFQSPSRSRLFARRSYDQLSTVSRFRKEIYEGVFSTVVFSHDNELPLSTLTSMKELCRQEGISYFELQCWQKDTDHQGGPKSGNRVVDCYYGARHSLLSLSLKRILDLLFVSLVVAAAAPLMLAVAAAIKAEDGGPVLYVSRRVGKDGRTIRFFKFRSMVRDADRLKESLMKLNERSDGPLFKIRHDPRCTKVGRVIRHYSLDELPQLFNVFRGSLSLVGPRPHLLSEVASYESRDYLRLQCIPGVVGLPQIENRNQLGFREWVEEDIAYLHSWSVFNDMLITAKAAKTVIRSVFDRHSGGY